MLKFCSSLDPEVNPSIAGGDGYIPNIPAIWQGWDTTLTPVNGSSIGIPLKSMMERSTGRFMHYTGKYHKVNWVNPNTVQPTNFIVQINSGLVVGNYTRGGCVRFYGAASSPTIGEPFSLNALIMSTGALTTEDVKDYSVIITEPNTTLTQRAVYFYSVAGYALGVRVCYDAPMASFSGVDLVVNFW